MVSGELLPSGIQEIYDFLFFKLYLLSILYPEPALKLWQPVTLNSIHARVPKSTKERSAALTWSLCFKRCVVLYQEYGVLTGLLLVR